MSEMIDYPCPICGGKLIPQANTNNIYFCGDKHCLVGSAMTIGFVTGLLLRIKALGGDVSMYQQGRKIDD